MDDDEIKALDALIEQEAHNTERLRREIERFGQGIAEVEAEWAANSVLLNEIGEGIDAQRLKIEERIRSKQERAQAKKGPVAPIYAVTPGGVIATTDDLNAHAERAKAYALGARADATRKAYRSDWTHFESWCARVGLIALPATPETLGTFISAHADTLSVATLVRRISAVAVAHRAAGYPVDTRHPAIRDVMRGLRRERGSAQKHAETMTLPVLRQVLDTCDGRLLGIRDRALLLVGFCSGARRSELVALDVNDITVMPEGLRICVRRSKGDQEGKGQVIGVGRTGTETCPVAAYTAWIAAAAITEGAVFRGINRHGHLGRRLSTDAVARIVQRRVAAAGMDPSGYSGHSLRSGMATAAAMAGVEERVIQAQTRHRSVQTLRRYIREGELFTHNLAKEMGL